MVDVTGQGKVADVGLDIDQHPSLFIDARSGAQMLTAERHRCEGRHAAGLVRQERGLGGVSENVA